MTLDPLAPLDTFFREHPDFNRADTRRETEQLDQRQGMIADLLAGKVQIDDVLDCLSDQGIPAEEWVTCTIDNIDYVIDVGEAIDQTESGYFTSGGIWLPGRK